jgi:hypothetical protein
MALLQDVSEITIEFQNRENQAAEAYKNKFLAGWSECRILISWRKLPGG